MLFVMAIETASGQNLVLLNITMVAPYISKVSTLRYEEGVGPETRKFSEGLFFCSHVLTIAKGVN